MKKATDMRWLFFYLLLDSLAKSSTKNQKFKLVQFQVWTQYAVDTTNQHHQTRFNHTV